MGILEDVRLGIRALRRQPGFSAAAILVLALSIGANASVFSLVKSILLQPLAMQRPEELVALDSMRPDGTRYPFTIPYFLELRRLCPGMSEMAAYGGWNANLTSEAEPQRLLGVRATGNYFQMLGVSAQVGRLLEPEDDQPGRPKVVVITDSLWRRLFGGDRDAIGKQVRLNGEPYTLVGVLPSTFAFKTTNQDFAVPLAPESDPWRDVWNSTAFLRVFGRLEADTSIANARSQLNAAAAGIHIRHPAETEMITGLDAAPLRDFLTGDSRTMLLVLMAAVGLVLLIACANISSLALARAVGRAPELSIRLALGAPRWSVIRQLLIENLLLFVIGGVAGVVLAAWGVRLLMSLTPTELPRFREVRLDWVVVAIAFGTAMLCGLFSASIPAFRSHAGSLGGGLRSLGRGSTAGAGRSRVRAVLVIVEAAMSLVLVAGAGLLLESFGRLMSVDPGFRPDRVATLRLALPSTRYKTSAPIVRFHDLLRENIRGLPGVQSVGSTSILPLSGPIGSADFTIVGRPPVTGKEKPTAQYRMVDSSYFRTMGIPTRAGRTILDTDTADSQLVVVISQSIASLYWRAGNPVGSRLLMEDNTGLPRELEVVGVVGDTREMTLEEAPTPCVYVAMPQIPQTLVRFLTNNMFWVIRTENHVDTGLAVKRSIRQIDGDVAVVAGSMDQYLARVTAARRFALQILMVFAAAALLLAAGGLYALVSFTTAQRTREFGVRIALGARRADIAALVLRQGLLLAAVGVTCGTAATYSVSQLMGSLLYGVSPHDPLAIGGAAALLLLAAVAACGAPVRRALHADPVECLRSE